MKWFCILLLLLCVTGSNLAAYNFLAKVPHRSLSQKPCTIPFYGKSVLTWLQTIVKTLSHFQGTLTEVTSTNPELDAYTSPDFGLTPGGQPYLVTAKPGLIASKCASIQGSLPQISDTNKKFFATLARKANLTSLIVDVHWSASGLSYTTGEHLSTLESLHEAGGALRSDALSQSISRLTSVWSISLPSWTVTSVPASKMDVPVKSFCMVPHTRSTKQFSNSNYYKLNSERLVNLLKVLATTVETFITKLNLSQLDLTQSIDLLNWEGFPIFSGDLDDLSWKLLAYSKSPYYLSDSDLMKEITKVIKLVATSSVKLELGFWESLEGTCPISTSPKLSCVCSDLSDSWIEMLFEPVAISNKILSFNSIIYQTEGAKPTEESCFYSLNEKFYALTLECCAALLANRDDALNLCPISYLEQFSSTSLDNHMYRVDGATASALTSDCQLMKQTSTIEGADALLLSTCDLSMLSKVGKVLIKNFGNFFKSKVLGSEPEKIPTKDIILYSVCAIVSFLLVLIIVWVFSYYYKNGRYFICVCFKRKNQVLEPISNVYGQVEMYPLNSVEDRSLRSKPAISYR